MDRIERFLGNRLVVLYIWAATLIVTLWPILNAHMPPGSDLSVHLARVYAIHNMAQDADLQQFYDVHWEVLPNLAFDLVVLPLLYVMPVYVAGKVFVILSVLMTFAGVALIRKQMYGQVGYMPLLTAVFVYNAPVAIGLTNFYFGIGLALLGFALWIKSASWAWERRLGAMAIFSLALFFSHLLVFCLFGLVVGLHRLQQWIRVRKLDMKIDGVMAGQFVVPLTLLFFIHPPTHGSETVYGPLFSRLEAIVSPVLYFNDFDVAVGLVLIIIVLWLALSKRMTLVPSMRLTVLFLAALSVVMPVAILGIWLTHVRLPILACLLFIAAVNIRIPERGLRYLLVGMLVLLTVLRLDKVNQAIDACDQKKLEFIMALKVLPKGARILPVIEDGAITGDCLAGNYWHFPALAVIERSAFYPLMFVTKWPLNLKPELAHFGQKKPRPASPKILHGNLAAIGEPKWNKVISETWRESFDYLIWLHPGTTPMEVPAKLHPVISGEFYTFYKIE